MKTEGEAIGVLEERTAKRVRLSRIQKAILGTVALAGVLSIAALAPNAAQLLHPLSKRLTRSQENSIKRARRLLEQKGLLSSEDSRLSHLKLTSKGLALAAKIQHENYKIKPQRRWDGKWRVLIFDIPEKRRLTRVRIRLTLRNIGFARLQDSVWIYPYPCEEFVALLKEDFKVGYSVLYLVVEELEGDSRLRRTFGLNR